jgi:hypothetical protein
MRKGKNIRHVMAKTTSICGCEAMVGGGEGRGGEGEVSKQNK